MGRARSSPRGCESCCTDTSPDCALEPAGAAGFRASQERGHQTDEEGSRKPQGDLCWLRTSGC